jgi:hypothetical protein
MRKRWYLESLGEVRMLATWFENKVGSKNVVAGESLIKKRISVYIPYD